MPATCKSRGSWNDDFSLYAEMWEWAIVKMALDHFHKDVVDGNVPLSGAAFDQWWEQRVVGSKVTKFHKNWALLYEGLAHVRAKMEAEVPHGYIKIDESLAFAFDDRRNGTTPIEWVSEEDA